MRKFWRSTAECLIASLVLVCLTAVCYRLHFNLATAGLLYVIVVVLVARIGGIVSSIVASIIAALCLAYLAPPYFSFGVADPFDDVAIATFLACSLIITSLVSRVRKQVEDALSSVSYKAIEAEEKERRRIASDLHEDIGQRLTMLALKIEQVKTSTSDPAVDVSNHIDAILEYTLELQSDVKTLAHELYSPRLEYAGIDAVMSSFCRDYGKRRGVKIAFKSNGLPRFIPPDITLCLLRVLQEALQNAVKHSGVQQFDGRLWGTSDEIHLTVSDCGVGFNPEAARKGPGLGFHRLQERLKLVQGTVSIESQPEQGTTIHARVPFSLGTDSMRAAG